MAHCYKHKHISDEECPYCEIERWKNSCEANIEENVMFRQEITELQKQLRLSTQQEFLLEAELNDKPTELINPVVVCLCGSTRFGEAFRAANLAETLAGKIVLSIGCDMRTDTEIFAGKSPEELEQIKADLDTLHLHKIDMADEVLILNVGGYIGESTRRELSHALTRGKTVRYLESI